MPLFSPTTTSQGKVSLPQLSAAAFPFLPQVEVLGTLSGRLLLAPLPARHPVSTPYKERLAPMVGDLGRRTVWWGGSFAVLAGLLPLRQASLRGASWLRLPAFWLLPLVAGLLSCVVRCGAGELTQQQQQQLIAYDAVIIDQPHNAHGCLGHHSSCV